MSNNIEGLKKCYLALEDNESLAKLITGSPRYNKEGPLKQTGDDVNDCLVQTPSLQGIMQLRESGKMAQAAAMAFQLANLEASKKASPLRIKKLYVLAGHIYSQHSVDGASSREAVRCYKAAAAQHWLWLAAARALAQPCRADAALRAAARLQAAVDDLHPAQHEQIWCTIASIAVQARAFNLCSKAFIKLEALNVQNFENIAIEIFTKCKPKDSKGNKIDCPNCKISMPEWYAECSGCGTQFPGCAVSARALAAPAAVWACAACGARALHHELVLRHSCPMCHAHLA